MVSDLDLLARDKYDGDASQISESDRQRLESGEPLAYVIGWVPFLGTRISLATKPLIPRPETEWWTELLIKELQTKYGNDPIEILDLCAGSGCIGIAILYALPNARVTFAELNPEHLRDIEESLAINGIDPSRATLCAGDLFTSLPQGSLFDVIATNPPYIPSGRTLEDSVVGFEPADALFAGTDGLDVIRRVVEGAPQVLRPHGSIWMECDTDNVEEAAALLAHTATRTEVREDAYGRPRLVLAWY
jgi:release factor glutamine methyltransferase